MALIQLITEFLRGMTVGGYSLLREINVLIQDAAGQIGVPELALFIAGIVLTVVCGLFGYKLIKLMLSLCGGFVGYFAGKELFALWEEQVGDLPDGLVYLFAALIAVALIALSFWKFSYAWFCIVGAVTYALIWYVAPEQYLLMLAGALIAGFASMAMIRTSFVLLESFACASLGVSFLSACLPDVAWLKVTSEGKGMMIAVAVAVVFALVQFLISLFWKKEEEPEVE